MELADAFTGFNQELRGLLRDASARADQDARALGEIEAERGIAAGKVAAIKDAIKAKVDAGELPAVRSPMFQEGYASRVGAYYGSVLAAKVTEDLPKITAAGVKADEWSARLQESVARHTADLTPQVGDDFFAKAGFAQTLARVVPELQQTAAARYTANFKAAAEDRMADEGVDLALQLGAAEASAQEAATASVRQHLDTLRAELPATEVNPFYARRVVAPAVESLLASGKVTEARHVVDHMRDFDVTGKGGRLGANPIVETYPTLGASSRARVTSLDKKVSALRLWRNRSLAHNDHGTTTGLTTLPNVPLRSVGELVRETVETVRSISIELRAVDVCHLPRFSADSWAPRLLRVLADGLHDSDAPEGLVFGRKSERV